MSDFMEFMAFIIPYLLICVVSFGGLLLGVNYHEEYRCGKYAEITDRQTKWVFMDECYINTGDEWLRKDEYLAVLVAKQGLQSR